MFQGYDEMIVASVNIHLHELISSLAFIYMINQAYLHNQIAKYLITPSSTREEKKRR